MNKELLADSIKNRIEQEKLQDMSVSVNGKGVTITLTNIHFKADSADILESEKRKLDLVAEKLGTTRHNASQLINEHFNMSFHEFVNYHRINDAKDLLKKEQERNIIDIAYEVGYNNKVSFNKAFKKDTNLTPSQYLGTIKAR